MSEFADKQNPFSEKDQDLAQQIRSSRNSGEVIHTALATDERVIARVTDGIYRQPASALRELISNAYDADATRVVLKTDAPRFERIVVEDDGHGMSPETLANLILHIGGSAKRHDKGVALGVTSSDDTLRSPGGRVLIGKIGIGLFSVSQLTHSFQIITKVRGDDFRTVATVALRQYSDDQNGNETQRTSYESGKVNIWREPASDLSSHGTTIILTGIRPQARDTLRNREIWAAIERNEELESGDEKQQIDPPRYHIGRVDVSGYILKKLDGHDSCLPWVRGDSPADAFSKLVEAVWGEVQSGNPNPQLERIFDYYLRMIWQLGLAVPVPYVQGHLFDMDVSSWATAYLLSNRPKGSAEPIDLSTPGTLRNKIGLSESEGEGVGFEVFIDDVKLLRPIKFIGLPSTEHALKQPIIFAGKCREEFSKIPTELSGGPLDFEAYLLWTPKVAPTEHQGALVRIHGSSGTLFDPTFMRYQISEQTRLRQITCEIFVKEGLDSALNIDRESFNTAHPHSVFLTKWLHGALRQLATTQKRHASEARVVNRDSGKKAVVAQIQSVASASWVEQTDDPAAMPPLVEFTDAAIAPSQSDAYIFRRSSVVDRTSARAGSGRIRDAVVEEKLKGITQVLASFGLLDTLSRRKQESLLKAIYKILDAPEV